MKKNGHDGKPLTESPLAIIKGTDCLVEEPDER